MNCFEGSFQKHYFLSQYDAFFLVLKNLNYAQGNEKGNEKGNETNKIKGAGKISVP
jgi:hypothetical protein